MPNLTRRLVQLSFDGIVFPYIEITMDGEMRDHVHEYPHSPGGAPEKLGRRLYVVNVTSKFHGDFVPKQYADLWPGNLNKLQALFEAGATKDLVLPQIGAPIRAYCTNWQRTLRSSVTSGEAVTFKFREDQERLRLIESAIEQKSRGITNAVVDAKLQIGQLPAPKQNIFDRVMRACADILAYKDQFDLYNNLLEAKCNAAIGMLRELLATADFIGDPSNFLLCNSLHQLLSEVRKVRDDQKSMGFTTSQYVVRHLSTLSEVSVQIYGTSARSAELLSLNAIDDPLTISQGTAIRYYKDAA